MKVGEYINVGLARDWLKNYISAPNFYHATPIKGHFFGSEKLIEISNLSGVVGTRFYHGLRPDKDEQGNTIFEPVLMAVGVNKEGNDILTDPVTGKSAVLDMSSPCPTDCPQPGKGLEDY